MKTKSKALLLSLCAVLLVAASVLGTMAYLTDKDTVTNTFTVGSVGLKLDEAEVKPDGTYEKDHDTRVQANKYHLIPGCTYYKDPTVTVEAGSEESYVRMIVTLNFATELQEIFGADFLPQDYITGWENTVWKSTEDVTEDTTADTLTYEFRYVGTENKGTKEGTVKKADSAIVLDDLFESFTLPAEITNEQLAKLVTKDQDGNITDQFTITVVAHAIQADGFADVNAAWAAFDAQTTNP